VEEQVLFVGLSKPRRKALLAFENLFHGEFVLDLWRVCRSACLHLWLLLVWLSGSCPMALDSSVDRGRVWHDSCIDLSPVLLFEFIGGPLAGWTGFGLDLAFGKINLF
jgi:hypothetical protein